MASARLLAALEPLLGQALDLAPSERAAWLADVRARTPDLARELQDFVMSRLAVFKRPRWVEFVNDLPKTATGKLQRFKLRDKKNTA